jgi:23S rRNA-/tRNA-specific pseudouridylate synthase
VEKKPLIPIDEGPLDVLYESPSVIAVKKPKGIKVHPSEQSENGTLLNRVFQHNRWLAHMEKSIDAGVLHVFEEHDHGLMLFNKNDDFQDDLEKALEENTIEFSYSIIVKGDYTISDLSADGFTMILTSQQQSAGYTIIDLTATSGNTQAIRDALFSDLEVSETTFYCYQISLTLPHSGEKHAVSLRETSKTTPSITVFHAPP